MREIKFRAWDKEDKNYNYDWHTLTYDDVYGESLNEFFLFERVVFEQYTNLDDINGREIYEGDIVFDTRAKDYNVVKFHKGAWTFNSSNDLVGYFDNELKVVGNIHENPELLEGE